MSTQSPNLHEELHPLLVSRIRLGTALVGVSIVFYGVLELWQQRAPLGLFFGVKAVQMATVIAVWLAVDPTRSWRRSVLIALALVAEVCATLALSGILTDEVASAPLLFALVTMGSATLLPWGLGPQAITVALAATALVANVVWIPLPDGFGYMATAAGLAFFASLCVAYELDQHRLQRHLAERDERASTSALRDEILLAERSSHAARELLSGGDTAQVLARLCRTTTRLLACDASYTFVRDADDAKVFVAVASDGDSGTEWVSRRALRIPDIVLAGLLDRLDRDEPVVLGGGRDVLPVDGAVCVYTALFAGREVAAIQVAVRRRPEPFSPGEIELARRLAHTASAALAQARLLETSEGFRSPDVQPRVWRELQTPLSSILRLAERAADLSLPATERRALLVRIASTARDMIRLLERLELAEPTSPESRRTTLRG
jgi:GAF domain-containing protein